MPLSHALLALAVVAVWGTHFAVIKLAIGVLPPVFLATLRFTLAFAPAALFLKRPAVPLRLLARYGVLIGVGQFGLLYLAMTRWISPGLASLVIQTQVFFTIVVAMGREGERLQRFQWLALALSAAGLAVIAGHGDGTTTPIGIAMVLVAAACWAAGNLVARHSGRVDMLDYVVWASVFAVPPLLVMSLLVEGPAAIAAGMHDAGWGTWAAVLSQSVGNTLFGYAAWAWLLARHPAATVSPMALAVPVFGLGASAYWLGEPLPAWKIGATALVLGGLAINLLWPLWRRRAVA
jgi:O-acetylserine/cysteine efflux transporter